MSAVLDPENQSPGHGAACSGQVDEIVRRLPAMDLATLEAGAALLTRVDRKYVVPVRTLKSLVHCMGSDWAALEIEGRRQFGYTSTYFDTEDLATYRAHLQRRRRRYKVRVRQYVDSDSCMLEVKRKGLRGLTVKDRRPHPDWQHAELGVEGNAFVAEALQGHVTPPVEPLTPVVVTSNRRATLVSLATRARLTVDTDLTCGWGTAKMSLRPGFVVLESKVQGHVSSIDRMLRSLGERPVAISKYCIGVAALGLELPTNPWRRTLRRYFEIAAS